MNYYAIPGHGIFGGIKTAAQFVALLDELDVPCCLATPDGKAPQWFRCTVPVVSQARVFPELTAKDTVIFSLPFDYPVFKSLPCRLIYHCQGIHPAVEPIARDPAVLLLTAWRQAREVVAEWAGRLPLDSGIGIAEAFFFDGRPKYTDWAAAMPRRGADIIQTCRQRLPQIRFDLIDGMKEQQTAARMMACDLYLATAVNEPFGLPALEAMAAGCVVVSVPPIGGEEYLRHGVNCIVAPPDRLADQLTWLAHPDQAVRRTALREQGLATAFGYTLTAQRRKVRALLERELGDWLCREPLNT